MFSAPVFIGGVKYNKKNKSKCHILNFLIGEAKLAIYLTRRDKLQTELVGDVVALWKRNVKARLRLEFCFYKATKNVEAFEQQWGCEEVLCAVSHQGDRKFAACLG